MTNEEAIKRLKYAHFHFRNEINEVEMKSIVGTDELEEFTIAINSIQENTKLKYEIERLQIESAMNTTRLEKGLLKLQEVKIIDLKAEIEQLKSELEQSVKLPCKVGDVVYWKDMSNYMDCIISCIEIEQSEIYFFLEKDNMNFGSVDINDFGKTIFLTREEAEQSLKGAIND